MADLTDTAGLNHSNGDGGSAYSGVGRPKQLASGEGVVCSFYSDNGGDDGDYWAIQAIIGTGIDELTSHWEFVQSEGTTTVRWSDPVQVFGATPDPLKWSRGGTSNGVCSAWWGPIDGSLIVWVQADYVDPLSATTCLGALQAVLPGVVKSLADWK